MTASKGMRLHIGIFGRRNVGKSSLLNALVRQDVSIVSREAGTTTDPVEKPMELQPLGPVVLIDTAGIDDQGELGALRVQKTRKILARTDFAILVADSREWGPWEEDFLQELAGSKIPLIVVFNKIDLSPPPADLLQNLAARKIPIVRTSANSAAGVLDLRAALLANAPSNFLSASPLLSDLVGPGELAALVVPVDKEAPTGRLILPQVQSIRDLLDGDALCMVVKDRDLRAALQRLVSPPKLVVTDSQAFLSVAADTPPETLMTSFSILFSRFKGDLIEQVSGAMALDRLVPGDSVLIAESCSHHPVDDDIGRVKIPLWLNQHVGGPLKITHVQGHDFPEDLSSYKLVIHCGGCMTNRREMLGRILKCSQAGVPITNYGLAIAHSLGILERALGPFPAALDAWRKARSLGCSKVAICVRALSPSPSQGEGRGEDARFSVPKAPLSLTLSPLSRGAREPDALFVAATLEQPCSHPPFGAMHLDSAVIERWLRETRPEKLAQLYRAADRARQEHVGNAVHLRGLIEISNHCVRQCGYCGLRAENASLERYRMSAPEILACAREAVRLGYGTVVLQSGEDPALTADWIADLVRCIKSQTSLAVTLSLGERSENDLATWKAAGADRYLLRFETSDRSLFNQIHPALPGHKSDRIELLQCLSRLGYEAGGGVMVGIPGQTYTMLAEDVMTFKKLDLDMIGIGPYIAHPATPLGRGEWTHPQPDQVPNTEDMVYKTIALARLICPTANLPATTALATINRQHGRELGLARGANVIMPNLTPINYRKLYDVYPNKACETAAQCHACLSARPKVRSPGFSRSDAQNE